MRVFAFSVITAFNYFLLALRLTNPAAASALLPRKQVCANAPNIVAGKPFNRRAAPILPSTTAHHLSPRKSTKSVLWCAQGTSTYIILTMNNDPVPGVYIEDLLHNSAAAVAWYLRNVGDGLVVGGEFAWTGAGGMFLRTENSNNRQQTYGVLAAALSALLDYMSEVAFGAASFFIFDGGVEVGMGKVG